MDSMFKELTNLINKHEKIILMTHAKPDLDGMGSAIALFKIINRLKKHCYIVLPKQNIDNCLKKALSIVKENIDVSFISEEEINEDKNTLLIVLDTQKPELVECLKLLDIIQDKIIIDHHIKSDSYIKDALCYICDSTKSSVVEIIVEYLKFLNYDLDSLLATILLAGIEVDTNSFNFKTTEQTFKVAGFLINHGANLILKQEILKEPKDELIKRYDYIKNSQKVTDNIIVCVMDDNLHDNVEIASLAKELLKIESIQASFAIGKLSNNIIGISARSMGNINVGEIMNLLGGGGHLTDAACQIEDKSIEEVSQTLKKVIKEGNYEGYIIK